MHISLHELIIRLIVSLVSRVIFVFISKGGSVSNVNFVTFGIISFTSMLLAITSSFILLIIFYLTIFNFIASNSSAYSSVQSTTVASYQYAQDYLDLFEVVLAIKVFDLFDHEIVVKSQSQHEVYSFFQDFD